MVSLVRWFFRAAAISLTITGCTFPEVAIEPGQKYLVVHAVLDAGSPNQIIFLSYSHSNGFPQPVRNATVTLRTPEGVQMTAVQDSLRPNDPFVDGQSGTYRISLGEYGVTLRPGATYSLHVHTLAGEDATGTTTIPQGPAVPLDPPLENFSWTRDTLKLVWTPVVGAASYQVSMNHVYPVNGKTRSDNFYERYFDAPITYAGNARVPFEDVLFFPPGQQTIAIVAAVDINYYEYYRLLSDPFYGAAPSKLTGAVGVFGSMVPIVVRRLDVR